MLHPITLDKTASQVLDQLFEIEFIKECFALAGGTSLALQIGHRKSIDLDLFTREAFSIEELKILLYEKFNREYQYSSQNSRMLFCYISDVKCDFVVEPAKLLKEFKVIEGISYFSIEDIAAMKLHTICGRGKRKDFFDVFSLTKVFTLKELIDFFILKYDESQLFFLYRSLQYFEDAEFDLPVQGIKPFDFDWKEIKEGIVKLIN